MTSHATFALLALLVLAVLALAAFTHWPETPRPRPAFRDASGRFISAQELADLIGCPVTDVDGKRYEPRPRDNS